MNRFNRAALMACALPDLPRGVLILSLAMGAWALCVFVALQARSGLISRIAGNILANHRP
jgi:hypothetical protein